MISIKNPHQIEKMREAGAILHEVLTQVRAKIEPGITTKELDHFAEQLIRKHGCIPSFLHYHGFPASLCTSVNEQVVHGIPGKTVLKEGDIVSIDGGLILDGWQADSAFTAPVGEVSEAARKLIADTERCFFEALTAAKAGNRVSDIGHAVQAYAESQGHGVIRDLCGHGIGREMHEDPEVPNYGIPGHGIRLRPGMTMAIEPMIAAGNWRVKTLQDGWTVVTADSSLCAHYEHTIAITGGEPEILTLPGYGKEGK